MTITAETLTVILTIAGLVGSVWRIIVLGTQLRDKLLSTDIAMQHSLDLMTHDMKSKMDLLESRLETITLLANGNKEAVAHTKARLLEEVKELAKRVHSLETFLIKSTDFEK